MVLLILLAIAIVFVLGLVAKPLLWVGAGLLVLWLAGWILRPRRHRWYFW